MSKLLVGTNIAISISIIGGAILISNSVANSNIIKSDEVETKIVWEAAYGFQAMGGASTNAVGQACQAKSVDFTAEMSLGWSVISSTPADSYVSGGICKGREIVLRRVISDSNAVASTEEASSDEYTAEDRQAADEATGGESGPEDLAAAKAKRLGSN